MAADLAVIVDGKQYDIDDFELGELEWLEEHIGAPLMDGESVFTIKAMVGFVYLVKKRENPDFTLDEARKVKMGTLGPAEEKKPAGAKRPTKAARSSSTAAPAGTRT